MLTTDDSVGDNTADNIDNYVNDSNTVKEMLPLMTSQVKNEYLMPEMSDDYEVAVPVVVTNSTPKLMTQSKRVTRTTNKIRAKSTQSANNDRNATDQLKCPKIGCYQSLSSQNQLDKHIVSAHPNARPYRCSYCPKAYKRSYHLKQHHNKTHADDQPMRGRISVDDERQNFSRCRLADRSGYLCDWPDCQQLIVTYDGFKSHMRIHRGDYRYACDECDKQYVNNYSLIRHQRESHNRSVDYECQYPDCHYKTSLRFRLNSHYMIHNNQKAFKCRINGCKSSFNIEYDLTRHKVRKHGLNRVQRIVSTDTNSRFMSQLPID
ncbi:unnamed protein product [Medioppia subpectinata]|uniref:C2H2-type domain-containing protein n=1 Tax=Medioppia subpectinata TaxID=1979941 RepID=A0A7R9LAJ7_9ACAR|nr:unnamed protein product [Medioppia subpectinata]CAG2116877.1 unnamed protein product [Medioppia subpectinata]